MITKFRGARGLRVENGVFIAGEGCPRANCPGLYTQRVILHPNVIASVVQADNAFFRILPLETPRFWPSAP